MRAVLLRDCGPALSSPIGNRVFVMPDTGPHIAIATLCERVLVEQDGVLSVIRVVDRLIQTATGTAPPEQMPPFLVQENDLRMVISLKSDRARGRFTVKIVLEDPSTQRMQVGQSDLTLQPGNSGANLNIGLNLAIQHEGVHWFDVLLGGPHEQEDQLMTRVPLQVVYQRQHVPTSMLESPPDEED